MPCRCSPPFRRATGETVHLWTTFSADQVDLNFADPAVLLRMLGVMLDYVRRGAAILRLDAIAYLWKTIGTDCIHRPETHRMVKLLRAVLDRVAPHVAVLTETNVPHAENIGYLGDGWDEAQMVYNFTLPPLLLHTMIRGDATDLSRWAATLNPPSPDTTFLNFSASHDGIGMRPLEGILSAGALERIVTRVRANGGDVSMRDLPGGGRSPYELNVTYIDAMRTPEAGRDRLLAARFLASQSIQYALPGVPATYLHSLLGMRNWHEGVRRTGRARSINRQPLMLPAVSRALGDPHSVQHLIFNRYRHLVRIRRRQPAFAPLAAADILALGPAVFGLRRRADTQTLWALTNVADRPQAVALTGCPDRLTDLIDGSRWPAAEIPLAPYQYRWLVGADAA